MSQSITLWNATYNNVPAVDLPKTGGGTARFTDVTDTTATASDVASGTYFYTSNGVRTQGTASGGGGLVTATATMVNVGEDNAIWETAYVENGVIKTSIAIPYDNVTGTDVEVVLSNGSNVSTLNAYTVYDVQGSATYSNGTLTITGNCTIVYEGYTDTRATLITKSISQNGTYYAEDDSADGYSEVTVNVSSSPTISSLTVTPSTSQQTFNSSSVDGYKPVVVNAMPTGSVTAPSSISGSSASVSTGTNTLTLSKTVSVTPSVTTAGYVSSGTAGNASVSLTASVTTKAAATIYPSTSDQTISSGTYLTGTQTIHGVSQTNLSAENIKSGTTISISNGNGNIWSVLGTYSGGGGTDKIPLLSTTSLGTLSTTSTSASDTGKSISLASSTNFTNYDMLIVSIGVDTHTNNRHLCSIGFIFNTGTSNVNTKNTYAVGSNVWNTKLGSTGTQSSRQSSTKYGIYPNSATVNNGTMSIPIYQRYNSNNTGTINGSYTARVYGVKLVDLVT